MRILLLILIISAVSCRQSNTVIDKYDYRDSIVVLRDTTFIVKSDSMIMKARFRCDSLLNVVMDELDIEKGRIIKPVVQWNEKTKTLYLEAHVDSQSIYLQWAERHIKQSKAEVITKTEIKVVKHIPWWSKTMSFIGLIPIGYVLFRLWPVIRKLLIKI